MQEADRNLRDARSTAQEAQASLKKAAASAKDTEQAMIEAEQVLDKAAKDAHTARQLARRLAAEAEAAAQAVDEAERALARAKKAVEEILVFADAHLAGPADGAWNVDPERIEHARDGVIDDVVDRARVIVKGGHRRKDHGAHPRQLQHVLEVDVAERRFADRRAPACVVP